jgi:hypothetical protein
MTFSLPAVHNKTPRAFGSTEKPTSFNFWVVPTQPQSVADNERWRAMHSVCSTL